MVYFQHQDLDTDIVYIREYKKDSTEFLSPMRTSWLFSNISYRESGSHESAFTELDFFL